MPAAHTAASGSARVRRKRAHAEAHGEEGGAERWLVTYADMLTLLLVLFIVLFSISVVNTSKFISLKTSLASVFGDGTSPGSASSGKIAVAVSGNGTGGSLTLAGLPSLVQPDNTNPSKAQLAAAAKKATQAADFAHVQAKVRAALKKAGLLNSVRMSVERRGLVINVITDGLVFGPNSAALQSKARRILDGIIPALVNEKRDIEVDGYTNQLKVSTGPYPSGWALSGARAATVVSYLRAHGVLSAKSSVGKSDQDPLVPPSNPQAATLNRRVAIVILNS